MRKINTQDAFKTARLIKHSNIKNVLLSYYDEGLTVKSDDIEKYGMRLFFDAISCLGEVKAEDEFYELIAGITEKTVKEIKEQPITDTINDLKEIAHDNDLKSFFQSVCAMISNTSI